MVEHSFPIHILFIIPIPIPIPVLSLIPSQLHPLVARQCIKNKVSMVTTSYVSPEMASLHDSAVEAGVCLINECGLDPGIDHLLAMQCIDETHQANGKVRELRG